MAEGLRDREGKKEERWRRQIREGSRKGGRGGKGGGKGWKGKGGMGKGKGGSGGEGGSGRGGREWEGRVGKLLCLQSQTIFISSSDYWSEW